MDVLEQCSQSSFIVYVSLSIIVFASEIDAEIDILEAPYMRDICFLTSCGCSRTMLLLIFRPLRVFEYQDPGIRSALDAICFLTSFLFI